MLVKTPSYPAVPIAAIDLEIAILLQTLAVRVWR